MAKSQLRIITLNVNGIRSAMSKGLWPWLNRQRADFVCFQEMRARPEQVPSPADSPKGWYPFFCPAERPGYSGVAIYTKHKPDRVQVGLGWKQFDVEGRYLQVDVGKLSVVSVYVPSGSSGDVRQKVKYKFLDGFLEHMDQCRKKKRRYVFCGDFNIAHKNIDIRNWKSNQKNSGFLPEERAWMDRLLDDVGYVDSFRVVDQSPDKYTWWSNRGRAYENNVGWRIDYQLVSPNMKRAPIAAKIYKRQKFSDHAPLTIDYELN